MSGGLAALLAVGLASGPVEVVPEYERTLDSVLVSVPTPYTNEASNDARGGESVSTDYLYWLYRELLGALPDYTQPIVAVRAEDRARVAALMEELLPSRNASLHVLSAAAAAVAPDMWAQDLGEPCTRDGAGAFLVSLRASEESYYNAEVTRFRFAQARQHFGESVIEAEFIFEAGNLAFDELDGRKLVLIGFSDVEITLEHYHASGFDLSRSEVLGKVSSQFRGAHVVEMGSEIQSPFIRHLDQAFLLLGDGVAIVNTTQGQEVLREQRQLERYRRQLDTLGYRTLTLENSPEEILGYRNSLNAVPFRNRNTGERGLLFPVFPDEIVPNYDGPLDSSKLRGKALAAYRLFESLSYRPIPVRDFAFVAGGNTHCILNVLD